MLIQEPEDCTAIFIVTKSLGKTIMSSREYCGEKVFLLFGKVSVATDFQNLSELYDKGHCFYCLRLVSQSWSLC